MRWLVLGLAIAAAGCSATEVSEEYYGPPRVMDKTRNTIKIWSGWKVDPLPVAAEHCGKVGLTPQLEKSQEYNAGYETVYWYKCV
jgi:uncharacterized lipoprotein YmbA